MIWLQGLGRPVMVASLVCLSTVVNAQIIEVDSPVETPTDFPTTEISVLSGAEDGVKDFGSGEACACGRQRTLFPCNRCGNDARRLIPTTSRGIDIYGWVAAGMTFNADHPRPSRFNGPVTFNDRDREFNMHQTGIVIEKTTDADSCGWQFGGRMDILYGTDGRFTKAVGLELDQAGADRLNSGRRFYHLALPQFYAEARYNDLSVIAGHFYTIIGYEGVAATSNFFYSHAYTMQYGEPFTHTGVLASWQATDQVEVKAGLHNGWDTFTRINNPIRNRYGFLGGFTWTSCDERTSLAAMVTMGDEPSNKFTGESDRYMYSVVLTRQIGCNWEYVLQHDNGWQHHGLDAATSSEWYGINQYLYYTINDCWKAGARVEWFRDDDATRVAALDVFNPASVGGFSGDFYEVTLGLNWTPTPNVTIRPEVRYDFFENANIQNSTVFGDDGTGAANKNNQFLFGIDGIVTF